MAQPPTLPQTTPWTGESPVRVTCPAWKAGVSTPDSVTRQSDTVTCASVGDSENTRMGGGSSGLAPNSGAGLPLLIFQAKVEIQIFMEKWRLTNLFNGNSLKKK